MQKLVHLLRRALAELYDTHAHVKKKIMIIEICPRASVLPAPPPDLPPHLPVKSGDCSTVRITGDHRVRVVVRAGLRCEVLEINLALC